MESERKHINVLKGTLIILVVIGHFGQTLTSVFPENIAYIQRGFMLFIYSFHMPLFMFVSGYLSTNLVKRRERAFKELLIPYILFQLVVGFCVLALTRSPSVFYNIFLPQMGAWYLMALFIFRTLMPDLTRIRCILILAVLLSIFACAFKDIGKEFAMNRVIGFFVYFCLGFYAKKVLIFNELNFKLNIWLSRIILVFALGAFIIILKKYDVYSDGISVLTRSMPERFGLLKGIIVNSASIIVAVFLGFVFINAIPKENKLLEYLGEDTMPLYLSHLLLYMAFAYLKDLFRCEMTVAIAIIMIAFSIVIFSSKPYRKAFNAMIQFVCKLIFMEEKTI